MIIKYKLFTILVAIKTLFCGCDKDIIYDYKDVSSKNVTFKKNSKKIDGTINESSGLAHASDSTFYTHNDGSDNSLYEIDLDGNLLSTTSIEKASFVDFEDMAEDDKYLYLGDIGNNSNSRRSLNIYKVDRANFSKVDTITFSYKMQKDFPPISEEKNFDCEAMICHHDSIFLFSKNRGFKLIYLYAIPNKAGNYKVNPIDSLYLKGQITGADISPDKSKMALLAYGKIYIFQLQNGLRLNNPFVCVKFPQSGQVEGILFRDDKTLIITNEGGKIFKAFIK